MHLLVVLKVRDSPKSVGWFSLWGPSMSVQCIEQLVRYFSVDLSGGIDIGHRVMSVVRLKILLLRATQAWNRASSRLWGPDSWKVYGAKHNISAPGLKVKAIYSLTIYHSTLQSSLQGAFSYHKLMCVCSSSSPFPLTPPLDRWGCQRCV